MFENVDWVEFLLDAIMWIVIVGGGSMIVLASLVVMWDNRKAIFQAIKTVAAIGLVLWAMYRFIGWTVAHGWDGNDYFYVVLFVIFALVMGRIINSKTSQKNEEN